MNDRTMQIMIAEIAARAVNKVSTRVVRPGTVTATAPSFVLIDGDTAPVEVPSIVGPLPVGQRVMVLFHPPAGALIFGTIGGRKLPMTVVIGSGSIGNNVATGSPSFTSAEYDPYHWWTSGSDIVPTMAGMYELKIAVDLQSAADYLRVLTGPLVNGIGLAPIPLGRTDVAYAIAATFTPRSINVAPPPMPLQAGDRVAIQLYQQNNASAARTASWRVSLEWKCPLP
jgi:hypothetical protein